MPRFSLRTLLAALLAAGAGLVLAAPAPAATPAQLRGISVSNIGADPADQARSLSKVKAQGAGFVRVALGWDSVEPNGPGRPVGPDAGPTGWTASSPTPARAS